MLIRFRKKTKRNAVFLFKTDIVHLCTLEKPGARYHLAGTRYPVIYLWNPASSKLFYIDILSGDNIEVPVQSCLSFLTQESNVMVNDNGVHIINAKSTCTIGYANGRMSSLNFRYSSSNMKVVKPDKPSRHGIKIPGFNGQAIRDFCVEEDFLFVLYDEVLVSYKIY